MYSTSRKTLASGQTIFITRSMRRGEMTVSHIEKGVGDRVLLWGKDNCFYVVSSESDNVKLGDTITYYSSNTMFGWFSRKA